jgi:hypothetical protein
VIYLGCPFFQSRLSATLGSFSPGDINLLSTFTGISQDYYLVRAHLKKTATYR